MALMEKLYEAIGGRGVSRRLLLLRTRGRRSGQRRTVLLAYVRAGDVYLVGTGTRPPAWLLNLRADPEVEIQVGAVRLRARADVLDAQGRQKQMQQMTRQPAGWQRPGGLAVRLRPSGSNES
jgi:deazaflavin-dependent oxidoreductase (nitroreductase family)